jgi:serine/threonine-protein kinase RsbW
LPGDLLDCGRSEAMTTSKPKVCLEIGSRTENVELVQIAVKASLQQLKLDVETSQSIGTAVREAVANAIQHGNSMDPDKFVRVECCLDGDEVVIQVRDQGNGFDPKQVPDPLDPDNLMRPNGRGIFFMKKFMDDIQYSFESDGGTVVTMRKRVTLQPPAASQEEEDEK